MAQLKDTEYIFEGPDCSVPGWQIPFCANYEYARESQAFRREVEKLRGSSTALRCSSGHFWRLTEFVAKHLPEFPVAWQDIPTARRDELLARIFITPQASDNNSVRYYGDPLIFAGSVLLGKQFYIPNLHTFSINFDEHPTRIKDGFNRWLEKAFEHRRGPIVERRGRSSNISWWGEALKTLGTFRRTRSGKQSYEHASNVSRNKTKVMKLIEQFERQMSFCGLPLKPQPKSHAPA